MKAFVTGGTGLLGSNLMRQLLTQGYGVLVLARNLDKAPRVLREYPGLEIIQGDMQDISRFAHPFKGSDILFHSAAYFRESFGLRGHWSKLNAINIDATMILPGAMFGPGDAAPTEAGQFVVDFLNGKVPFVMNGGFSVVDPRDVSGARISATQLSQFGERYLVAGRYHSEEAIGQLLAQLGNCPVPGVKLPGFAMHWVAKMVLLMAWLTRRKTVLTINAVKPMVADQQFDSSKAKNALNIFFRPLAESLKDRVAWYHQNGYVK